MLQSPLRQKLRGPIDEEAILRMWRGIRAQPRARGVLRRVMFVAAVASAVLVLALLVALHRTRPADPTPASSFIAPLSLADGSPLRVATVEEGEARATWLLSDGSRLVFDPGTRWEPLAATSSQFASSLRQGSTTFEVKPGGPRRWIIDAGPVSVEVIGTRFSVRRDALKILVAVERGAVLVRGEPVPDKVQRLTAGQSIEIRLAADPTPTPSASADGRLGPTREPLWFERARAGRFTDAYDDLGGAGVEREAHRTRALDHLLALSDIARRSGHPADAMPPLERIIIEHPDRPEAALAAVTLGRLLLDQLAAPTAAARSLEQALTLGAPLGLREDVYARLIEAYEKSGDQSAAQRAMERYEHEFPRGTRGRQPLHGPRGP